MTQILIDDVEKAKIGDIITVAVHSEDYDRGMHLIGKVMETKTNEYHKDIIEFTIDVLAHCDGNTWNKEIGMRKNKKIGIIRIDP